ncbi:MAG: hypothetical protein ABJ308_15425 [Halieaceae bacterium]
MIIFRNVLALIIGLMIGSRINMALIVLGPSIILPPAGVDVTDVDSIAASLHMFEAKHYVFPFLAHALGTFSGAFIAWLIAASHRDTFAWGIGAAFLAGGIFVAWLLPAPAWFIAVDLLFAYIPMAWLAIFLAGKAHKTFNSSKEVA